MYPPDSGRLTAISAPCHPPHSFVHRACHCLMRLPEGTRLLASTAKCNGKSNSRRQQTQMTRDGGCCLGARDSASCFVHSNCAVRDTSGRGRPWTGPLDEHAAVRQQSACAPRKSRAGGNPAWVAHALVGLQPSRRSVPRSGMLLMFHGGQTVDGGRGNRHGAQGRSTHSAAGRLLEPLAAVCGQKHPLHAFLLHPTKHHNTVRTPKARRRPSFGLPPSNPPPLHGRWPADSSQSERRSSCAVCEARAGACGLTGYAPAARAKFQAPPPWYFVAAGLHDDSQAMRPHQFRLAARLRRRCRRSTSRRRRRSLPAVTLWVQLGAAPPGMPDSALPGRRRHARHSQRA